MLAIDRFTRVLIAVLLCLATAATARAQDAAVDFSDDYERIYQIRVVSRGAGGKASIGSGFQIDADGRIATNYHVVADAVRAPEQYRITYVTHDGRSGELTLLDFDVISDLALLQHPAPGAAHFELAERTPSRGEQAFALGNPGDWGIVMVEGPTNGLVEHRFEDRVLFSGSLNGGMSGGPSLNRAGRVIGVNVATAGSQLSFLVPIDKLQRLMERRRQLDPDTLEAEIAEQLTRWQQRRIAGLLAAEWPAEAFAEHELFGEIRGDFQCWGDTNESDEERAFMSVSRWCRAGDEVYLGSDEDTGHISFWFSSVRPKKLNAMQFARSLSLYMSAGNATDYESSTDFACETDFVNAGETDAAGAGYHQLISCVRGYTWMDGLYDSVFLSLRHTGGEVLRAQLSMTGVGRDQILAMNRRFLEHSL